MFHRRSSEFEPRISAITDHLRGIRRELGGSATVPVKMPPVPRRPP